MTAEIHHGDHDRRFDPDERERDPGRERRFGSGNRERGRRWGGRDPGRGCDRATGAGRDRRRGPPRRRAEPATGGDRARR